MIISSDFVKYPDLQNNTPRKQMSVAVFSLPPVHKCKVFHPGLLKLNFVVQSELRILTAASGSDMITQWKFASLYGYLEQVFIWISVPLSVPRRVDKTKNALIYSAL